MKCKAGANCYPTLFYNGPVRVEVEIEPEVSLIPIKRTRERPNLEASADARG
jgi:hypothetical protein